MSLKKITIQVNMTTSPKPETISFVSSGCTHFFNAQHIMIELTQYERAFYDYLCEAMNKVNNNVTINNNLKQDFVAFIANVTGRKHQPSLKRMYTYKSKLVQKGLLIERGDEFFCINPKYAYKGSEIKRKQILKQLIEDRAKKGLPISMLVDKPVNKSKH